MSTRPDLLRKYADLLNESKEKVREDGFGNFFNNSMNAQARNASQAAQAKSAQTEKITNSANIAFQQWNAKTTSMEHAGTQPTVDQFVQWLQKYFKTNIPINQPQLDLTNHQSVYAEIMKMAGHYYAGTQGQQQPVQGQQPAAQQAQQTGQQTAQGRQQPAQQAQQTGQQPAAGGPFQDPNVLTSQWEQFKSGGATTKQMQALRPVIKNMLMRMGATKVESKKNTRRMITNEALQRMAPTRRYLYEGLTITEARHVKLWENAGRKLTEAQMTSDQITKLFKDIETQLTILGGNKTLLGKGKGAASAINNAWEDLKTKIQNSGPVQGLDAKYDQAAEKLKQATGGEQGVMQYVQKYRDFAKAHPIAQSFIYAALIAAAGISGAGAGGAAALGLFKMVDKLLQGDKFSSAAYSGAKTGAMAYGASKVGDMFRGGDQTAATSGQLSQAEIDDNMTKYPSDLFTQSQPENTGQSVPSQADVRKVDNAVTGAYTEPTAPQADANVDQTTFAPKADANVDPTAAPDEFVARPSIDPFTLNTEPATPQADANVDQATSTSSNAEQDFAPQSDFTKPDPNPTTDSTGQKLEYGVPVDDNGNFKMPRSDTDLSEKEYGEQIKAYKEWQKDFKSRWPNAEFNSDGSVKNSVKPGLAMPANKPPLTQSGHRIGRALTEAQVSAIFYRVELRNRAVRKLIREGMWDNFKQGVSTIGHNLTTKITANKLEQAWKKAGSPVDSEQVKQIIVQAGVDENLVNSVTNSILNAGTPQAAAPQAAAPQAAAPQAAGTIFDDPAALEQKWEAYLQGGGKFKPAVRAALKDIWMNMGGTKVESKQQKGRMIR
jgi:ribosomal protein L12E/L44/L45/RPP1/RPP2